MDLDCNTLNVVITSIFIVESVVLIFIFATIGELKQAFVNAQADAYQILSPEEIDQAVKIDKKLEDAGYVTYVAKKEFRK